MSRHIFFGTKSAGEGEGGKAGSQPILKRSRAAFQTRLPYRRPEKKMRSGRSQSRMAKPEMKREGTGEMERGIALDVLMPKRGERLRVRWCFCREARNLHCVEKCCEPQRQN